MSDSVRLSCCVPFCRRWQHGKAGGEMICWDHWKRIPLKRRRAYFRAIAERAPEWLRERGRSPRWMLPRIERQRDRPRDAAAVFRLFDRMKRDAITRALASISL